MSEFKKNGGHLKPSLIRRYSMESKEEKFLKALFGDEPKAKSLSF